MSENKKNRFPIEILPKPVQEYFKDLEEYNKLNPDFLCGSFLAFSAISIGNKYRLRYNENFCVNTSFWLALVGSSSTKKTPVMSKAFGPLMKLEVKRHKAFKKELGEYNVDSGSPRPTEKQTVVDDFTIESLYKIFSCNPQGILIKRDELDGLIEENGRYNSGGNEQKFLSMFSGVPSKINRKKDDESYMTEKGLLCMIGGIQTEILSKLFSQGRDKNGFVQRMLFVQTDNRSQSPPKRGANEALLTEYYSFCETLELIPDPDYPNIPEIDLTWEAYDCVYKWFDETLYGKYINGSYNQLSKSYFMKMEAYTLKFALIMEVLNSKDKSKCLNEISLDSVEKGIQLSEYFIESFLNVLTTVKSEEEEQSNLETILDYLHSLPNKSQVLKTLTKLFRKKDLSYDQIAKLLRVAKSTVHSYMN